LNGDQLTSDKVMEGVMAVSMLNW